MDKMKKRIVLNKSYGGFELSEEAKELYCKYKGITLFKYNYDKDRFKLVDFKSDRYYFYSYICDEKEINKRYKSQKDCEIFSFSQIPRDDEILIRVIEELGERSNTELSKLEIEELEIEIDNHDGMEYIKIKGYDI